MHHFLTQPHVMHKVLETRVKIIAMKSYFLDLNSSPSRGGYVALVKSVSSFLQKGSPLSLLSLPKRYQSCKVHNCLIRSRILIGIFFITLVIVF